MTSVLGSLLVKLGLDMTEFRSGLSASEKELRKAQRSIERTGRDMQAFGTSMSLAATVPLIALGKTAVTAAMESRDAIAQVEASLASMGNAAGRSSEQLQALAAGEMSASLYDDDEILRSVTANLLTFGNVAGEQFDRAQAAAIDMAAKLQTDLQSAAIAVGKALNDPVKGLTALGKAGIQFTDQQKEQIKAMVAVGDAAGAQRLMLAELERQFAGSAEAARQADPFAAMKQSFADFQENVGAQLLQILPSITGAIETMLGAFNALSPGMQQALVILATLTAAFGPLMMVLGSVVGAMAPFLASLKVIGGASGTLAAARFGVVGLVAAFGPWTLAIGAVAAALGGLYYVLSQSSTETENAERAVSEFGVSVADADGYLAKLSARASDGQAPQRGLASAVDQAKARMKAAADEANRLITQLYGVEAAAFRASKALAMQRALDSFNKIKSIQSEQERIRGDGLQWGQGGFNEGRSLLILQRQLNDAKRDQIKAGQQLLTLDRDFSSRLAASSKTVATAASGSAAQVTRLNDNLKRTGGSARTGASEAESALKKLQDQAKKLGDDVRAIFERVTPGAAELAEFTRSLRTLEAGIKAGGADGLDAGQISGARKRLLEGATADQIKAAGLSIEETMDLLEKGWFATDRMQTGLDQLSEAANDNAKKVEAANVRVVESFQDTAEKTLSAIDRTVRAVQGGSFLDILSAVIGLGMQLGSIGVFGDKVASRINSPSLPKYADGTGWHPGGWAMVGERGPELVRMPRGSSVIPNHQLGAGAPQRVEIYDTTGLFRFRVDGQIAEAAPGIAAAGAEGAQRRIGYSQSRQVA